jgi:hypothetical protein
MSVAGWLRYIAMSAVRGQTAIAAVVFVAAFFSKAFFAATVCAAFTIYAAFATLFAVAVAAAFFAAAFFAPGRLVSHTLPQYTTYTLAHAGHTLYNCRFVNFHPRRSHISKYTHVILLSLFASITSRHRALGNLFCSSHVALRDPMHKNVQRHVRTHMLLTSHSVLRNAANQASRALGRRYVAAHVHVGEGTFNWCALKNVRWIWYALVMATLDLLFEDAHALEKCLLEDTLGSLPAMGEDQVATRTPHPPLPLLPNVFTPQLGYSQTLHTDPDFRRLNKPLFILMDAEDPR